MENYSLMAILRNDPDFRGRLAAKTEAIKKDKNSLNTAAKHTHRNMKKKYLKELKIDSFNRRR